MICMAALILIYDCCLAVSGNVARFLHISQQVLQRDSITMGEEFLEPKPDAEVLKWQCALSLIVRLAHWRDVVEFCRSPTREGADVIEMHSFAIGNKMPRGKTFS